MAKLSKLKAKKEKKPGRTRSRFQPKSIAVEELEDVTESDAVPEEQLSDTAEDIGYECWPTSEPLPEPAMEGITLEKLHFILSDTQFIFILH